VILLAILLWLVIIAAIALLMDARKRCMSVREVLADWFERGTR